MPRLPYRTYNQAAGCQGGRSNVGETDFQGSVVEPRGPDYEVGATRPMLEGRAMGFIDRGKVQGRTIVFVDPLPLPDGTPVVVHIEQVTQEQPTERAGSEGSFATLPFFGMWADRKDMGDSVAWVRRERERWQERPTRPDRPTSVFARHVSSIVSGGGEVLAMGSRSFREGSRCMVNQLASRRDAGRFFSRAWEDHAFRLARGSSRMIAEI